MTQPARQTPPGLIPYLSVRDATRAIAFYAQAFGATEVYQIRESSGKVGHAELEINGGRVMLSEEYPDYGSIGPETLGGTPVSLTMYVPNADAAVERAVAAGATLERPVADQFFGCRTAWLKDPFGHRWAVQQKIEEVAPEEIQRRFGEMMGG